MQMVKHTAQLSSKMFESVELARPGELKFLIKLDTNEEAEELIAYNQLMDYIQKKIHLKYTLVMIFQVQSNHCSPETSTER